MRKLIFAASIAGLALATSLVGQPPGFRTATVATGLDLASAMAFAPDGRLFVTERVTGKIRVWEKGQLAGTWATIPVTASMSDSRGLLGIAVDPDFLNNGYVYVSVSNRVGTTENSVMRLRENRSTRLGGNATPIGPSTPSSWIHNVGPLVFGGDAKLYVSHGNGDVIATSQDPTDLRGKVLRMNSDGTVPVDNPIAGSYVWTLGHRNSWGLAVHPVSGAVYLTENGHRGEDELDLLLKGANYGWPIHEGTEKVPDPTTEDPLWVFNPTIGPTGSTFYRGSLYPVKYRDGWMVCDYNNGKVLHAELDASGTSVTAVTTLFDYPRSLYGVVNGPDGNLYTLYSTASGRGADRIDRIVYDSAPNPGLALTATSNVAVGGSFTVTLTGKNGAVVLAWLGATKFPAPIPTPFGNLWVPDHIVIPPTSIATDNRVYIAVPLPNIVGLKGLTMHVQGGTSDGTTAKLTNPDSLVLL